VSDATVASDTVKITVCVNRLFSHHISIFELLFLKKITYATLVPARGKMMSEAEAEKKFQEDLEKAKALSMEAMAMEEFR
jgi:hypothetical protein